MSGDVMGTSGDMTDERLKDTFLGFLQPPCSAGSS